MEYPIDFKTEMKGGFVRPLKHIFELQTMTNDCYGCPMFEICNGCKKTIKDHKEHGLADIHCRKMKTLAADIIASNKNDVKENH
jgi:sulfatase maturation enzyme AslB (radical SAM superfamily)